MALYYCPKHWSMWCRRVAKACLLAAIALYPHVASTAVVVLTCVPITITAGAASKLNGGDRAAAAAAASPSGLATVSVNAADPFFVCWSGSHTATAALVTTALVVYTVGLPVITFSWLWRDPWLRAQLLQQHTEDSRKARLQITGGCLCRVVATGCLRRRVAAVSQGGDRSRNSDPGADDAAIEMVQNPALSATGAPSVVAAALPEPAAPIASGAETAPLGPATDPALEPLLGSYRTQCWYTKHLDLTVLLTLSLLRGALPRPTTLGGIVCKAAVSVAVLLGSLVHVLVVWPHVEAWMGRVRALLLIDAIGCILLNAAAAALDAGLLAGRSDALGAASLALLALCAVTVAVLLCGFAAQLLADAGAEQKAIDAVHAAEAAVAVRQRVASAGMRRVLVLDLPWAPGDSPRLDSEGPTQPTSVREVVAARPGLVRSRSSAALSVSYARKRNS